MKFTALLPRISWAMLLSAGALLGCDVGADSASQPNSAPSSTGNGAGTAPSGGNVAAGGMGASGGGAGSGGTAGSLGGAANTAGAHAGMPSAGAATSGGNSGSGGAGGTGLTTGLLAPAQGALFGAFVGTSAPAELETTLGRKLAIVHDFFGWSDDWTARVTDDLKSGHIPLITWEAWNGGVGVPLDDIISGAQDTLIKMRAAAAKSAGQKFFLRWGHEMNGNWYPWDGFHNGASAAASAKYVAAYRHIHDLFVGAGATNVLWVFCPNVDSVPGEAWNQWANYYPGDAYVDWVGFDGYNWGSAQTWQTFPAIVGRIYSGLAAKNKPILIAETASAELGGDKAAWITGMLPALKTSYPNIKALVWFHVAKEQDWRLDSSAGAKTAAITMAMDPYLNP